MIAQLQQLTCLTADGDLISKTEMRRLIDNELAIKVEGGWNIITAKGILFLSRGQYISQ